MNGADPLAQLRDVHLPPDPGWWPPAIGWWLAALLVLLLIVAAVLLIRWLRRPTLYRSATRELDRIASLRDDAIFESALAAWLRRCMIGQHGQQVAGLTGEPWLDRLEQSAPDVDMRPLWERLFVNRYAVTGDDAMDRDTALTTCRQWSREALR
ncbi:DUF4381 domain-containing protein [uncultured Abyssibacter sp.]|uniref:DUF4381 domain-containing protein n=1 Tax=uncultured Abyssibacter sp. TaxID=2320202 RepID=UPI0032B17E2A